VPLWKRRSAQLPTVISPVARVVALVIGTALLVAGTVAVFRTTNSVGSATLVAAGTVIAAFALFGDQLESLEGGGVKIQLRAVASKLAQARRADAAGNAEEASDLRAEAQLLFAAIEPIAAQYEEVRQSTPYGRQRTSRMGELVDQAQEMAKLGFVTPEGVERLFHSGEDGNRIMALGLMRGDPAIANSSIVTSVIRKSRSSFEQWHALVVSLDMISAGHATPDDVSAIRDAIEIARGNGSLGSPKDRSRIRLADRINKAITASSATNKE
jgi:hypothetical protein